MSNLNDYPNNNAGIKLTRSEEKFNKLFEYSPVGMAMIKHETGEFIEVNQALLQWTGYTKEEFLRLSFWDITPLEYQDQEQQQMLDLESKGRFGPNEKEYIRKDGSRFPIRLKGFMIEDVDGTKLVWGIIEDISNEYQRIFESLQDSYMQFDLSYKLIMVNQGTVKMFGYTTKDEMIGKSLGELFADHAISKSDVERITEKFNQLIFDGRRLDEQFEIFPRGSNLPLYIRYIADVAADENGVIVEGVIHDISELKKLELQVTNTAKQNQRILENLQDAYFQADMTGTFIIVNPKAVMMYRYQSADELIGQKAEVLYENAKERDHLIEELRRNGVLTDYVCKGKRRDNTTFWVSMNVQYVKDNSGNIIGTEGLVRDISERIELEEAVKTQRDHLIEINDKLSKSEEKFKGMLETIPAAVFLTVDNHTKIEYLSSYFTEMLGYSYDDLPTLEKWFEKAYPDETNRKQAIEETTDNLVKSLSDPTFKTEIVSDVTCKDRSVKHVLWRGIMLENQWLGCGFDLTEIYEASEKLSKRLLQSVIAISKIGEMRDVYTAGHQKRVKQLACEIGHHMGLSDEAMMNLSYGALIHDIGKIYIPSDILNKPGKISGLEYQILQTHAENSYEIVKEIDFPKEIPTMIYQHHERLDGSGYPQGLSGDEIILESRILAVADVVEAMTSHRPYRVALGIDAALEEILLHRGTKYDPKVVDICVNLFKEDGYAFQSSSVDYE